MIKQKFCASSWLLTEINIIDVVSFANITNSCFHFPHYGGICGPNNKVRDRDVPGEKDCKDPCAHRALSGGTLSCGGTTSHKVIF